MEVLAHCLTSSETHQVIYLCCIFFLTVTVVSYPGVPLRQTINNGIPPQTIKTLLSYWAQKNNYTFIAALTWSAGYCLVLYRTKKRLFVSLSHSFKNQKPFVHFDYDNNSQSPLTSFPPYYLYPNKNLS